MKFRAGRLFVALGTPSIWPDLGWHWIDGRKFPPILTSLRGPRPAIYGRGLVVSLFGVMLWITVDKR